MMNTDAIKSVAHSNETASAIFLLLSQKKRGRKILNLDLIKSKLLGMGVVFDQKEFDSTFAKLQDLEIGTIIHGRGGSPSFFVLNYDLRKVVETGLGGDKPKKTIIRRSKSVPTPREYVTITIPSEFLKISKQ